MTAKTKTKAKTKNASMLVRMTRAQKNELAAAATKAGAPVSTWLLMAGLRAARDGMTQDET